MCMSCVYLRVIDCLCVRAAAVQEDGIVRKAECIGFLGGTTPVHRSHINCVKFDAEGVCMFSGDGEGVVVVWSVSDKPTKLFGYRVSRVVIFSCVCV